MRFFETLQQMYPRLSRGLGYFRFNQIVHDHLQEFPPAHPDLGRAGEGIGARFRQHARLTEPLAECLAFDEAELRARLSPWERTWSPQKSELIELFDPSASVRYASSFALLRSDFRVATSTVESESGVEFVRLKEPEYHVCLREERRIVIRRVERLEARFFELCAEMPLSVALSQLELEYGREVSSAEAGQNSLASEVQHWVTRAVQTGIWIGVQTGPR
jgi:hypothetical protein